MSKISDLILFGNDSHDLDLIFSKTSFISPGLTHIKTISHFETNSALELVTLYLVATSASFSGLRLYT